MARSVFCYHLERLKVDVILSAPRTGVYRLTTAVVIGLQSVVTRHRTDASRIGICIATSAKIVVVGVIAIAAIVPLHRCRSDDSSRLHTTVRLL